MRLRTLPLFFSLLLGAPVVADEAPPVPAIVETIETHLIARPWSDELLGEVHHHCEKLPGGADGLEARWQSKAALATDPVEKERWLFLAAKLTYLAGDQSSGLERLRQFQNTFAAELELAKRLSKHAPSEALQHAEAAANLAPDPESLSAVAKAIARYHYQRGQHEAAARFLNHLWETRTDLPSRSAILPEIADLAHHQGEFHSLALRFFSRAFLSATPCQWEDLLHLAELARLGYDFDLAQTLLSAIAQLSPDDPHVARFAIRLGRELKGMDVGEWYLVLSASGEMSPAELSAGAVAVRTADGYLDVRFTTRWLAENEDAFRRAPLALVSVAEALTQRGFGMQSVFRILDKIDQEHGPQAETAYVRAFATSDRKRASEDFWRAVQLGAAAPHDPTITFRHHPESSAITLRLPALDLPAEPPIDPADSAWHRNSYDEIAERRHGFEIRTGRAIQMAALEKLARTQRGTVAGLVDAADTWTTSRIERWRILFRFNAPRVALDEAFSAMDAGGLSPEEAVDVVRYFRIGRLSHNMSTTERDHYLNAFRRCCKIAKDSSPHLRKRITSFEISALQSFDQSGATVRSMLADLIRDPEWKGSNELSRLLSWARTASAPEYITYLEHQLGVNPATDSEEGKDRSDLAFARKYFWSWDGLRRLRTKNSTGASEEFFFARPTPVLTDPRHSRGTWWLFSNQVHHIFRSGSRRWSTISSHAIDGSDLARLCDLRGQLAGDRRTMSGRSRDRATSTKEVVSAVREKYPDDPSLALTDAAVRAATGDFTGTYALAQKLRGFAGDYAVVRDQMIVWAALESGDKASASAAAMRLHRARKLGRVARHSLTRKGAIDIPSEVKPRSVPSPDPKIRLAQQLDEYIAGTRNWERLGKYFVTLLEQDSQTKMAANTLREHVRNSDDPDTLPLLKVMLAEVAQSSTAAQERAYQEATEHPRWRTLGLSRLVDLAVESGNKTRSKKRFLQLIEADTTFAGSRETLMFESGAERLELARAFLKRDADLIRSQGAIRQIVEIATALAKTRHALDAAALFEDLWRLQPNSRYVVSWVDALSHGGKKEQAATLATRLLTETDVALLPSERAATFRASPFGYDDRYRLWSWTSKRNVDGKHDWSCPGATLIERIKDWGKIEALETAIAKEAFEYPENFNLERVQFYTAIAEGDLERAANMLAGDDAKRLARLLNRSRIRDLEGGKAIIERVDSLLKTNR